MRFLGQIRPMRLLDKFTASPRERRLIAIANDQVVLVEPLEAGPMVTLQSSTGTYMAEGYGAHNTYILDGEFDRLWKEWKGLFPSWWTEALKL